MINKSFCKILKNIFLFGQNLTNDNILTCQSFYWFVTSKKNLKDVFDGLFDGSTKIVNQRNLTK